MTGKPVLADDSGLEVDYLQGRPGIYSARFAGEEPPMKKQRLFVEIDGRCSPEQRKARFVCAMALAVPGQKRQ